MFIVVVGKEQKVMGSRMGKWWNARVKRGAVHEYEVSLALDVRFVSTRFWLSWCHSFLLMQRI